MKKAETTNVFIDGLVMDLNPLVTPNNVLVNCLNGTLITYHGNENSLQNDMGNGRVETAYLPEGYVPLGTAELGGIIYIVSYNPLIDKCQIGSFPSPERNITSDELGETEKVLNTLDFYDQNGLINSSTKKLILLDKELHPGDKFQIYCTQLTNSIPYISAKIDGNSNPNLYPKYLKLNVVAVQDNGQITNLNNTLVWHDTNNDAQHLEDYYILSSKINQDADGKLDLDEYRELINSNYNVFNSKIDGKLAILAELECIEQFDVSWDAIKNDNGQWQIYLYTNWSYSNEDARDKINLYSVRVDCDQIENGTTEIVISDYPKSSNSADNDILNNQDTTFYTPYYVDQTQDVDYSTNGGITTPRYNDGSDNQFLITTPIILNNNAEGIAEFTIYPGMPFGYLGYLKQQFSINISKLGTGEIDLIEYRYYWDTNSITLNWGLEAYPERNKQIEYVRFNFFKFGSDNYNWICDNSTYIDNNYIIKTDQNTQWDDGSTASELTLTPQYVYTVDSQSSYSGNFTEVLDSNQDLDSNSLYLVELEINYNNEKTLKYYRFLYTSNIFNSYYFTVTDYKDIVLQDVIDTQYNIKYTVDNLQLYNTNKDVVVYDSDNNEVNQLPYYIEADSEETVRNYYIQTDYQCNIKFNVQPTLTNTFTVTINNIEFTNTPTDEDGDGNLDNIENYNDGQISSITNSQVSSSGGTIDPITMQATLTEGEFQESSYSGKYEMIIKAPLQIQYNYEQNLIISYEATPLVVRQIWLIYGGRRKDCWLYLSEDYVSEEDMRDGGTIMYLGDDKGYDKPITYFTDINSQLKQMLQNCDVVIIKYRMYHDLIKLHEMHVGVGTTSTSHPEDSSIPISTSFPIAGRRYSQNSESSAFTTLYAILGTDGDVKLFSYTLKDNELGNWYGRTAIRANQSNNSSIYRVPIGLSPSDTTILDLPFTRNYFKLVETSSTYGVKGWSRIIYYSPYSWSSSVTYNCKSNIVLSINECELNQDNHPNNLRYNKDVTYMLNVPITESEDYSTYIDQIQIVGSGISNIRWELSRLDQNQQEEYVNEIITGTFSTKRVYDFNHNEVSYLFKDTGSGPIENTRHKLYIDNGRLKVTPSTLGTNQMVTVLGHVANQRVGISDIYGVNDSR